MVVYEDFSSGDLSGYDQTGAGDAVLTTDWYYSGGYSLIIEGGEEVAGATHETMTGPAVGETFRVMYRVGRRTRDYVGFLFAHNGDDYTGIYIDGNAGGILDVWEFVDGSWSSPSDSDDYDRTELSSGELSILEVDYFDADDTELVIRYLDGEENEVSRLEIDESAFANDIKSGDGLGFWMERQDDADLSPAFDYVHQYDPTAEPDGEITALGDVVDEITALGDPVTEVTYGGDVVWST